MFVVLLFFCFKIISFIILFCSEVGLYISSPYNNYTVFKTGIQRTIPIFRFYFPKSPLYRLAYLIILSLPLTQHHPKTCTITTASQIKATRKLLISFHHLPSVSYRTIRQHYDKDNAHYTGHPLKPGLLPSGKNPPESNKHAITTMKVLQ